MKYEEPKIELVIFEREDVIRTSDEQSGTGGSTDMDWVD